MRFRTVIVSMVISTALLSVGNVLVLLMRYQERYQERSIGNSGLKTNDKAHNVIVRLSSLSSADSRHPGEVSRAIINVSRPGAPSLTNESTPPSGFELCRNNRRPSDAEIVRIESNWQLTTVLYVDEKKKKGPRKPQRELIYLYSAYYDDRPAAGSLPSVRILALSTLRRDVPMFCAVWFTGIESPYVVKAIVNAEAGSGYSFRKQNHHEYAYICTLPAFDPLPSDVSVSAIEPCPEKTGYTTLVSVRYTPRTDKPPIEFGVCVTAGYGYITPEVFVEWVELNRMFGASEINLYDTWYSPNMSTTFDYYRSLGILNVHRLHHPEHANNNSGFFNKVRNVRILALNDCQLMNMYRYRYMIVIDTDEIIIPRTTSNYSELITELDRQRKVPGVTAYTYVFLNIYFLLDFDPDTTRPSYLRTIQYRHRVRPKSYGYAPKSIVDPRQCSVLFNHYCARYLARPPNKEKRTYRVPFATASSHHYRRCGHFYAYSCDQLFAEKTEDDFMLKHEGAISSRVTQVLQQLDEAKHRKT